MIIKVQIDGQDHFVDPNKSPISIIFNDDKERLHHANNMMNFSPKAGKRVYCIHPENMPIDEVQKFME